MRQFKPGQLQTGSLYNISASYAVTASYALNGGGGGSIDTGSFATTGSNTFIGNQTITGSVNITGSTTQIGNNTLLGNTTLSGSIIISGSTGTPSVQVYGNITHDGYVRFNPVSTNIDTSISASYIYVSGSTNDLYFSQNGSGYSNVTRLRWLEGNIYTGVLTGGVVSGSVGGTTFNVSSGSGIIVTLNATTASIEPYPTIKYVKWPSFNNVTPNYLNIQDTTWLGIDSNGNLIQQTNSFINGQFDNSLQIGSVIHPNLSTISLFKTFTITSYGIAQQTYEFIRSFGAIKVSGHTITPSGSSLSVNRSSGVAYALGRNYVNDANKPSLVSDVSYAAPNIFRYYKSGSTFVTSTGTTTIDPTQYNTPNTATGLSTAPGGQYTIQRLFYFPNQTNTLGVYYGRTTYNSIINALSNLPYEPFEENNNTLTQAIFVAYLIVKGGTTNLSNTSDAQFIQAGTFRNTTSGGGGTATISLDDLSDVIVNSVQHGDILAYNGSEWANLKQLTGSYGLTGSLTATSFTGSLFGTATSASYVLNAVSASYAPDTTFPYTGSAIITGSLGITGSLSVIDGNGANSLNTNVRTLYGTNSSSSINWAERKLNATNGTARLDWRLLYAIDSATSRSIDWGNRYLQDASNVTSANWSTRLLTDASATTAVDWNNRKLYDTSATPLLSLDWRSRDLTDTNESASINWSSRTLSDSGAPGGSGISVSSIDWETRQAYDANGVTSTDWNSRYLYDSIGNISIDWENKALNDSIGSNTIYWDAYNNNYKITQYGYGETQISGVNQEEFSTTAINNASQNAAGEIIQVSSNIDPTVVIGDLVSLGEDGIWYQTDQASISGSCMLGICTEPYDKGSVFTEGTITVVTASGYTDTPFVEGTSFYGKPVYMRPGVLGGLTTTIPTTGYVRVVGHLYYNNQTNTDYWLMKFRPSNDWYVI